MNVLRQYELNRSDVGNLCQPIYCHSLPMALVSSLIHTEVCLYGKQIGRSWLLDHLQEMLKSVCFLPLTSSMGDIWSQLAKTVLLQNGIHSLKVSERETLCLGTDWVNEILRDPHHTSGKFFFSSSLVCLFVSVVLLFVGWLPLKKQWKQLLVCVFCFVITGNVE